MADLSTGTHLRFGGRIYTIDFILIYFLLKFSNVTSNYHVNFSDYYLILFFLSALSLHLNT